MNEPISSWPWGTGSPAKIACITGNGNREAMIANASPKLTKNPTLNRVADMPAATPRRTTGTEFMIEATLGAMNKPPPIPARIIGKTRMVYGTWYGRAANQMYEAADTSSPPVVKNRGPYRSERRPITFTRVKVESAATKPTGTLLQKIDCQPCNAVRTPPATRPIKAPAVPAT